jgi:hypothetical protein
MPFPRTRDELVAGGYKFSNHARCEACASFEEAKIYLIASALEIGSKL